MALTGVERRGLHACFSGRPFESSSALPSCRARPAQPQAPHPFAYSSRHEKHRLRIHSLPRRQQHRRDLCCTGALASSGTPRVLELPIFPLGVVGFPGVVVPLHIFEARYRVLFNTLLSGADGLEDGLIQSDKSYCGSRKFGLCWLNNEGGLAAIGSILHIERHMRLEDGRLAVNCRGVERFRILKVLEEKPIMYCTVEVLPDDATNTDEVQALAKELLEVFSELLQLNVKMGRMKTPLGRPEDILEKDELTKMNPLELSYWFANLFSENPTYQQILLQENSTKDRLQNAKDVLGGTVSYLRAKLALEGAFASSSGGDEPKPSSP